MTRHSRTEVWTQLEDLGLVCLFYHADASVAVRIMQALAKGGGRIVEFTNRGDRAHEVFRKLLDAVGENDQDILLGAGSVVDPATAGLYINMGADFIVGSVLNADVARLCNRRKVPYIPGCATPSEISEAEELGVEICKMFPADHLGGPEFVRAIMGPCPWLKLMPTGGVDATEENLKSWFAAGITCVGIGSKLVRNEFVGGERWDDLAGLTAQCVQWIREARSKSTHT